MEEPKPLTKPESDVVTSKNDTSWLYLVAALLLFLAVCGLVLWSVYHSSFGGESTAPHKTPQKIQEQPIQNELERAREVLEEVRTDLEQVRTDLEQANVARYGLVTASEDLVKVSGSLYTWDNCTSSDLAAEFFQMIQDDVQMLRDRVIAAEGQVPGWLENYPQEENCFKSDLDGRYRLYMLLTQKPGGALTYRVDLETSDVTTLKNFPVTIFDVPFLSHHGGTYVTAGVPYARIYTYDPITDSIQDLEHTQVAGAQLIQVDHANHGEVYTTPKEENVYYFRVTSVCVDESCERMQNLGGGPYYARVIIE